MSQEAHIVTKDFGVIEISQPPEMTRRASNHSNISRLSEFYKIKKSEFPGFSKSNKSESKKSERQIIEAGVVDFDGIVENKPNERSHIFKLTITNRLLLFMDSVLLGVVVILLATEK
jgi:hypothetical protein